ncbi:MAG: 50S ribosomal protein L11 methyltransferase [Nitrospinae bacterium]|nr:50S ribosomal protein L11 methyltransferase [Nitrospinota bacterium]
MSTKKYEISLNTTLQWEELIEEILNDLNIQNPYSYYPYKEDFVSVDRERYNLVINFQSHEKDKDISRLKKGLRNNIPEDSWDIEVKELKETDWQNEWKKFFSAFDIGKRLRIVPAWEEEVPSNRETIIVDPGMAFGTGGHATTFLCLEALEELIHAEENVLDFGAGSAILSVASIKLGAKRCDAVEIDPVAVGYAESNIVMNDCQGAISIICGDSSAIPNQEYEIVIANITIDIIMKEFNILWQLVKFEGFILLSGIISDRQDEMNNFLKKQGIKFDLKEKDGWCRYLIQKKDI